MDEREKAPTTATRSILSNNCIARKFRYARSVPELRLLDAGNDRILPGEEVTDFSGRIMDAVTVPAYDRLGRRRRSGARMMTWLLRSRIWVDAPDEEEDEDEKLRKSLAKTKVMTSRHEIRQ